MWRKILRCACLTPQGGLYSARRHIWCGRVGFRQGVCCTDGKWTYDAARIEAGNHLPRTFAMAFPLAEVCVISRVHFCTPGALK